MQFRLPITGEQREVVEDEFYTVARLGQNEVQL